MKPSTRITAAIILGLGFPGLLFAQGQTISTNVVADPLPSNLISNCAESLTMSPEELVHRAPRSQGVAIGDIVLQTELSPEALAELRFLLTRPVLPGSAALALSAGLKIRSLDAETQKAYVEAALRSEEQLQKKIRTLKLDLDIENISMESESETLLVLSNLVRRRADIRESRQYVTGELRTPEEEDLRLSSSTGDRK